MLKIRSIDGLMSCWPGGSAEIIAVWYVSSPAWNMFSIYWKDSLGELKFTFINRRYVDGKAFGSRDLSDAQSIPVPSGASLQDMDALVRLKIRRSYFEELDRILAYEFTEIHGSVELMVEKLKDRPWFHFRIIDFKNKRNRDVRGR